MFSVGGESCPVDSRGYCQLYLRFAQNASPAISCYVVPSAGIAPSLSPRRVVERVICCVGPRPRQSALPSRRAEVGALGLACVQPAQNLVILGVAMTDTLRSKVKNEDAAHLNTYAGGIVEGSPEGGSLAAWADRRRRPAGAAGGTIGPRNECHGMTRAWRGSGQRPQRRRC